MPRPRFARGVVVIGRASHPQDIMSMYLCMHVCVRLAHECRWAVLTVKARRLRTKRTQRAKRETIRRIPPVRHASPRIHIF